jgi:hypothetical protein
MTAIQTTFWHAYWPQLAAACRPMPFPETGHSAIPPEAGSALTGIDPLRSVTTGSLRASQQEPLPCDYGWFTGLSIGSSILTPQWEQWSYVVRQNFDRWANNVSLWKRVPHRGHLVREWIKSMTANMTVMDAKNQKPPWAPAPCQKEGRNAALVSIAIIQRTTTLRLRFARRTMYSLIVIDAS